MVTRAQIKKRMYYVKAEVGCVACLQDGNLVTPCDAHHLLDTGRRRGDEYTIALCAWHHRGVDPRPGQELTPSLAREPAQFHLRYGSDDHLYVINELRIDYIRAHNVGDLGF